MNEDRMTDSEVNEMVQRKEANLRYIEHNMGIWGMPYASERDSLNYWRRVQSGKEPRPRRITI